ncbi:MAG: cyclodeaminase/cyclohydrolase family protein [Synergistaceae bacterium]|nr:cyclodeaminase/cyclohydrolase family protein [Synergistaceae bacterium]
MSNVANRTIDDFLADLASDSPAPGGGSAAALSGALGAALVSMVANLTVGRQKYAEFNDLAEDSAKKAEALRLELIQCVNKDMSAFDGVMDALRMPKGTDEEKAKRSQALQESYKTAILAPVETINNCLEVMRLAAELTGKSNPNAASDLKAAAIHAQAGIDTALENVEINLSAINDPDYKVQISSWVDKVEEASEALYDEILFFGEE